MDGDRFLVCGEYIYRECTSVLDDRVRTSAMIHNDENTRRICGDTGDGSRGHPVQILSICARNDVDVSGEAAHRLPKFVVRHWQPLKEGVSINDFGQSGLSDGT